MRRTSAGVEYRRLAALKGPLAFLSGAWGLGYHEHVDVVGPDGVPQTQDAALAGGRRSRNEVGAAKLAKHSLAGRPVVSSGSPDWPDPRGSVRPL